MKISVATAKKRKRADALILPFWDGKKGAEAAFSLSRLATLTKLPVKVGDFKGSEGETLFLYLSGQPEKRLLLLGLGKQKSFSAESVRRSFSAAVRACQRKKCAQVNLFLPETEMEMGCLARALSEGVLLANYTFDLYKKRASGESEKQPLIESLSLIGGDKICAAEFARSQKIISGVYKARDLVNGNADDVYAQTLAQEAKDLAKEFSGVKTTVLSKSQLEKEKMGLLLAVNRGAMRDPALIVLEYRGDARSKDVTGIVGKGVSFDTGGINLKPRGSIEDMKADMSGAATVLGTIRAAAALKLKKNIIGVIPAVENAIDANSYKPGDVYQSREGKTVEIADTDAEGRLILADALSYLQDNYKVSRIIDLATLTGSIVVALGEEASGLFSNRDDLAKQIEAASEKTAERVWRMPLIAEYKEYLKSTIADMKNVGGARKGGSIVAALFLQEFIKPGMPWAHLDIAGTAYLSELKRPYHPTLATGVGVRLLIEFLESLE